ncbi:MAG TPA: F-box protein [Rhabdochlamydiaceae bacterium]|nr:F-box protein [Rhabdochlamydiaceae bacterium]
MVAALLPNDVLLRIPQFADRQTLAALCLVSKLFARSDELYRPLFAQEHPNLNPTRIQTTSWKELRIQRALAERNLLKGLFRQEQIYAPPPRAQELKIWGFQDRQFITCWVDYPNQSTELITYDVQKQKHLPPLRWVFPTRFLYHSLQEIDGNIYMPVASYNHPFCTFSLLEVDNDLTEVQRYTTNQNISSSQWIFCKKSKFFRLVMTHENHLYISTTSTTCITKTFNTRVEVVGHFFWGDRSLLMLRFPDRHPTFNIIVYDFDTLEPCFSLQMWSSTNSVKVLQQDQELIVFHTRKTEAAVYKIPSFPETPTTYERSRTLWAGADSLPIYLRSKLHYMTVLESPLGPNCRIVTLASHSIDFVFPTETNLTPCESQGLPVLLANDGKQVYVMKFNFIPTFTDRYAKIASKINIFIQRFLLAPLCIFGVFGLLGFLIWKGGKIKHPSRGLIASP